MYAGLIHVINDLQCTFLLHHAQTIHTFDCTPNGKKKRNFALLRQTPPPPPPNRRSCLWPWSGAAGSRSGQQRDYSLHYSFFAQNVKQLFALNHESGELSLVYLIRNLQSLSFKLLSLKSSLFFHKWNQMCNCFLHNSSRLNHLKNTSRYIILFIKQNSLPGAETFSQIQTNHQLRSFPKMQ